MMYPPAPPTRLLGQLIAVLVFVFSLSINLSGQTCDGTTDVDVINLGPHTVVFKGKTYSNGISYWTYCIENGENPSVGHWTIGNLGSYLECLDADSVADPGTSDNGCNGNIGCDPSQNTDICGLKYDCGVEGVGNCDCFTFALYGDYTIGLVFFGIKAGPNSLVGLIQGPSCLVPVPVELISFEAVLLDEVVQLQWTSVNEENNAGYEIERSLDGVRWEAIGFVSGNGTIYEETKYTFFDEAPMTGSNYYRLRQYDHDGTNEVHMVREVFFGGDIASDVRIFPNPASGEVQVNIGSKLGTDAVIRVFNPESRLLKEYPVDVTNLASDASVTVALPESGLYFIQVQTGDQIITKKVVNQ